LAFENNFKILTLRQRFTILGDKNIDYGCYDSTTKVKSFTDSATSLSCEQLITWPTSISLTRKSILDHAYIKNSMLSDVVTAAVIENDISDHLPIIVKFKFKSNRKEQTRPLIRKISPQKEEHFEKIFDGTKFKN